jgi:hypothetical protein
MAFLLRKFTTKKNKIYFKNNQIICLKNNKSDVLRFTLLLSSKKGKDEKKGIL